MRLRTANNRRKRLQSYYRLPNGWKVKKHRHGWSVRIHHPTGLPETVDPYSHRWNMTYQDESYLKEVYSRKSSDEFKRLWLQEHPSWYREYSNEKGEEQ